MKRILLCLCVLGLVSNCVFSQGEVPVDFYTGTPLISIPIWSVESHGLVQPITLRYDAKGVKLAAKSGRVGISWELDFGGSIKRTLRGLPDDFKGSSGDSRKGWIYLTPSETPGNFMTSSDLLAGTCDEVADYNTLNAYNNVLDPQPDVFSFSVGGLSGKFVFDQNGVIRTIPYMDVDIVPTYVSETIKKISSFTVTTNDGYVYTFASTVWMTQWAEKYGTSSGVVNFNRHQFELYDKNRFNATVGYTAEWLLTEAKSPEGGKITLTYLDAESLDSGNPVRFYYWDSHQAKVQVKTHYTEYKSGTNKKISIISGDDGGRVAFEYGTFDNHIVSQILISDNRSDGVLLKRVGLSYENYGQRQFLSNIQEIGDNCTMLPPTTFDYTGMSANPYKNGLPEDTSNGYDHWGYYNGDTDDRVYPKMFVYPALPLKDRYRCLPISNYGGTVYTQDGNSRLPNESFAVIGSLKSITYSTGGVSQFEYELHRFNDAASGQEIAGGGLRVKKTTYFDGHNKNANIVKTFSYVDGAASSGKIFSMPSYAVPLFEHRPLTGSAISYTTLASGPQETMYKYLLARSATDISPQETSRGSAVAYSKVKVSRPGLGSVTYEYEVPGFHGSASSGYWTPVENKFARQLCTVMGITETGSAWSFPYAPSPEIDFARGLVTKKSEHNESQQLVRETITAYTNLFKAAAPLYVPSVFYTNFPYQNSTASPHPSATLFFGRVNQPTEFNRVIESETVIEKDPANNAKNITVVNNFSYATGSAPHRYLKETSTTNSDGTVYRSKYFYPRDFGTITSPVDYAASTLHRMKTERRGVAIEKYTTIQKTGGPESTVDATLTLYSNFGTSDKLAPKKLLSLAIDNPSVFTPAYINAGRIVRDANYKVISTTDTVDAFMQPVSATNLNRTKTGIHRGYNNSLPMAVAQFASHDEFAFNGFDVTSTNSFAPSATAIGPGRHGGVATHPQVKLTATVKKVNSNSYTLSFWFKKQTDPVTFNVKLRDAANSFIISDVSFPVSGTSAGFEYFERTFPAVNLPPTILIEVQGQFAGALPASGPGLLPLIDDIAFYPSDAELTTYIYNLPFGANAITSRHQSSVITFDALGRQKLISDEKGQITQRFKYAYHSQPEFTLSAGFSSPSTILINESFSLTSSGNTCVEGETYEWNIDGVVVNTGTTPSTNYAFTTAGEKKVTLTVSKDGVSTSGERIINVKGLPIEASVCVKGVTSFDGCEGTVSSTSACGSITAPVSTAPMHFQTRFRAMPVGVDTYSYQWYFRQNGSPYWTPVGNDQEYQAELDPPNYISYEVKCDITAPYGRKGQVTYQVYVSSCNE